MGMDVIFVGPMPTPAVAMLVRSLRADLGVMISASHNSFEDNGIKLFGPSGYKLSDSAEAEIESLVEQQNTNKLATPNKLGRARRLEDAEGRYIEFAKNTFPKGLRLDGLKIVVDCANGAAYKVVPAALWELGSDVVALGISPNGLNINKACGSTNTELMRETVVNEGANLGIALDGDADRVILADEEGNIIDGDQILALIAKSWKSDNRLKGEGIVTTVMANLGLERFLTDLGLNVVRTRVGDRYVVEKMLCDGFNVGGEQSGHIILNDYNTTGDGLVAALEVLSVIVQSNRPASEVCRVFDPVPQILKNVVFAGSSPMSLVSVKKIIADGEKKLEGVGRLLIRQSGTESIIRVMAEGSDETMIKEVVNEVCSEIEKFSK
jgi:phosphoglucosamine mutase